MCLPSMRPRLLEDSAALEAAALALTLGASRSMPSTCATLS